MYGIFPYMKTHRNSTIHVGKYTNLRPMHSVVGKIASCPSFRVNPVNPWNQGLPFHHRREICLKKKRVETDRNESPKGRKYLPVSQSLGAPRFSHVNFKVLRVDP